MAKNVINTVEGFPAKKNEDYGITPCDVLFNHVEKPKNYLNCQSVNLFDNRWRVNIYSKRFVEGIEGKYISQSYFVHFDKFIDSGTYTLVLTTAEGSLQQKFKVVDGISPYREN
jgi:hypothetical protein